MKLQLTLTETMEGGQIVSFKTTQAVDEKLKALAEQNNVTKSAVIRRLLEYGFKIIDIQNKTK
jgi:predicted transcriptional regulator